MASKNSKSSKSDALFQKQKVKSILAELTQMKKQNKLVLDKNAVSTLLTKTGKGSKSEKDEDEQRTGNKSNSISRSQSHGKNSPDKHLAKLVPQRLAGWLRQGIPKKRRKKQQRLRNSQLKKNSIDQQVPSDEEQSSKMQCQQQGQAVCSPNPLNSSSVTIKQPVQQVSKDKGTIKEVAKTPNIFSLSSYTAPTYNPSTVTPSNTFYLPKVNLHEQVEFEAKKHYDTITTEGFKEKGLKKIKEVQEKQDPDLDAEGNPKTAEAQSWGAWIPPISRPIKAIHTLLTQQQASKRKQKKRKNSNELDSTKVQTPDVSEGPQFKRPTQLAAARQALPIYMHQQQLVEAVHHSPVTLVCGETGSGKSTQVPQFLLENGYRGIAVTQPRRLATSALAARVAEEMGVRLGSLVGYQVRHENKCSEAQTEIKFMTDGILLNQMNSDFLLSRYEIVVVDEAHERKVNTDILIGLLSRVVVIRKEMWDQHQKGEQNGESKPSPVPLRLVIMSATLRIHDFQSAHLFQKPPPLMKIAARTFPVHIYHEQKTPSDYIELMVKKCVDIHRRLPYGDVLAFVTGREEVAQVARAIEEELQAGLGDSDGQNQRNKGGMKDEQAQDQNEGEESAQILALGGILYGQQTTDNYEPDQTIVSPKQQPQVKVEGKQKIKVLSGKNEQVVVKHPQPSSFKIYKLYSSLPSAQQHAIFQSVDPSIRKIIICTNIAETSITVPNVRYVVDCGHQKHRYYDGIWRWRKGWGTRAMAQQRAGRAGRTTTGYCYRLYSGALLANIMEQFPQPEISRLPLESVLLQMKNIGVLNVYKFPYPTKPAPEKIATALTNLIELSALTGTHQAPDTDQTKLTQLGRVLALVPLAPKLSKLLLLGRQKGVAQYALYATLAITAESLFALESQQSTQMRMNRQRRESFKALYQDYIPYQCTADIFVTINILGQFFATLFRRVKEGNERLESVLYSECSRLKLNSNTMRQIYYNADQICEIYSTLTSTPLDLSHYFKLKPPQCTILLDMLLECYARNIFKLSVQNKYTQDVPVPQEAHLHHLSTLFGRNHQFVCCVEVSTTTVDGRPYMRNPFVVNNFELLASLFGSIESPKQFQWRNNKLIGLCDASAFGWTLPLVQIDIAALALERPLSELSGVHEYTARLFLDGAIFSEIKLLHKYLVAPISTIKTSSVEYRVQRLVQQFRSLNLWTKAAITEQFSRNARFLKDQLKLWFTMNNFEGAYEKIRTAIIRNQTSNSV